MSHSLSLVQRVQIASPCTAAWDQMIGDDKSRFCSQCKLNVYNLSAMTEAEGERLIIEKEGKLCARIYRRYDGTILTKDCPVGLAALRKRMVWAGVRTAAALVFIAGATATAIAGISKKSNDTYPGLLQMYHPDRHVPRLSAYQRAAESMKRWLGSAPLQISAGWSGRIMMGTPAPTTSPRPWSQLLTSSNSPAQIDEIVKTMKASLEESRRKNAEQAAALEPKKPVDPRGSKP